MKRLALVAVVFAFVAFVSTVQAADDPTGTWNWKLVYFGRTFNVSAKLKLEGDKLTGTYTGRGMESPIEDASVKDGKVVFAVIREGNGIKFTTKYTGTLDGDTIKGKLEVDRDGQIQSRDWEATRPK